MIELEPRRTGSAQLDVVLGGGISPGSLLVIAGAPGTGKTVLAQQICFANATEEHPALYYTTLSESHSKLIPHLEGFSFFDKDAIGRLVHLQHLKGISPDDSVSEVAEQIARTAFEAQPSVIVVDSAKALRDASGARNYRSIIYEMASRVAHTDAVLILVGEYAAEELGHAEDFAVADVIVALANEASGVFDQRWLRVLKVRGSEYLSGRHSFEITSGGITVQPRLESMTSGPPMTGPERVSTGVPGLDAMAGGGLPSGSVTLLSGPSGIGKTVLGLHFANEGVAKGERVLYLSFQESAAQLFSKGRAFGWDLNSVKASHAIKIMQVSPVEMGLDSVAAASRAAIEEFPPNRVVIEGLGDLDHAAGGSSRLPDFMWSFLGLFRAVGATTYLTSETHDFFGPTFELARGVSFLADNAILLRYIELESEIRRALGVVKMRESDHEKSLVEFEIGKRGLQVKGKFAGVAGVLTGTPVRTEERFREFFGKE